MPFPKSTNFRAIQLFMATAFFFISSLHVNAQLRNTNAQQATSCLQGTISASPSTVCAGSSTTLTATPASLLNCFSATLKTAGNVNYQYSSTFVDNQQNVYFSGAYTGSVNVAGQSLPAIGNRDFFMAKYTACGAEGWAIYGSSSNNDQLGNDGGKAIAVDNDGNAYIVGRYNGNTTINSTAGGRPFVAESYVSNLGNPNAQDGFLIKVDSNGIIKWGVTIYGGSNDGFNGVTVDGAGNPIVTAVYNASPTAGNVNIKDAVGSYSITPGNSAGSTAAVIKFNSTGAIQWITKVYNKDAVASSVTTDGSNNIYFTGWYNATSSGDALQVNDAASTTHTISNGGIGNAYIIKLSNSGNWQWGNSIGNEGTAGNTQTFINDITVDGAGNPWLVGYYSGSRFNIGTTEMPDGTSTEYAFLVNYDASGNVILAKSHQQASTDTRFYGVAVNGNNIAACGNYRGDAGGLNDVLLVTFNNNGNVIHDITGGSTGDDIAYCVRPFGYGFMISGANGAGATIPTGGATATNEGSFLWNTTGGTITPTVSWTDINGIPISGNPVAVTPSSSTTYYCTFDDGFTTCTQSVDVVVNPLITPLFETPVPSNVCSRQSPYTLPTPYNVNGSWSPSSIVDHTGAYTFIPDEACGVSVTFNINLEQAICLIITQVQPICRGSISFELDPNQSDCNGNPIHGTWTPAMVNNQVTTTYHYVPDPEFCVEEGDMTIEVRPLEVEFAPIQDTYCVGTSVAILPTEDANGVHGTWLPATISNTASGSYVFTPYQFWPLGSTTSQCPYGHPYTLNVTILQGTHNTIDVTACESYTWDCNQTTYIQSGQYICYYTDANGCASSDTLNLTINYGTHNTIDVTACDSYTWACNGVIYTQSGTYTCEYTNADGCPSSDILNLTINYGTHNTVDVTACDSYTWACNGVTYTQSGTYTCEYTNADGCPSSDILNLTINYGTHNTIDVTACDSYTWACNGVTYTQSGTYTCEYTNADGCPSSDILNLTINYGTHNTIDVTACDSYTWACNGVTYTQSGTYTCEYTNADGCPSSDILNLTINYGTHNTVDVTACDSYTWACNGVTYTQSGTYTCEYTNADGCPSSDILNLTINYGTHNTIDVTACDSYTWACNGVTYTQSGTYTCEYTNADGCPSSDILNLTINYGTHNTVDVTACDSYTWACNGVTYTQSGTYTCEYTNADGCPSSDILNLTINYGTHNTIDVTACDSYTWACNGVTYTQSGTYTCEYTNADGCPSSDILNLTINYGTHNTIDVTACDSYTWACNGVTYTQSGTYTCEYTNADGCPSSDILNLTINYGTHNTVDVTACDSYTWACNGVTYTQSGTYTCEYTNADGCPSSDILNLTINYGTHNTVDVTACDSYTWACNGVTYTQSGTYTCEYTNADGCPSSDILNLTILPANIIPILPNVLNDTITGCQFANPNLPTTSDNGITGTWSCNGIDFNTPGVYTCTFTPDPNQCAVTVTIYVNIREKRRVCVTPVLPICQGTTITPTLPTTFNCPGGAPIFGTWTPSVINNQNSGVYCFHPDETTCSYDTCINIIVTPRINPSFTVTVSGTTTTIINNSNLQLCTNQIPVTLPTTSNEGVTGIWIPGVVINGPGTWRFIPTSGCANRDTIYVTVSALVTPDFSCVTTTYCEGTTAPTLPSTSCNGVTGTWSPSNVINTSVTGTSTYTFTPDAGQCASTATLAITITPAVTVNLSGIQTSYCVGSSATNLPTTISGITGSWSPSDFINTSSATATPYTFTPDAGQCAASATITITVNAIPDAPQVSVTQPTCTRATGTITVTSPLGTDYTYYLDTQIGGPVFTNVTTGSHSVTVSQNGCTSAATSVTINPQPTVPPRPIISGPTNICQYIGTNTPVCYTIVGYNPVYQYAITLLPPGAVVTIPINANGLFCVSFQNTPVGTSPLQIRVVASNDCGNSPIGFIVLVRNRPPGTPGSISASSTNICQSIVNGTPIVYTINPVAGATTYCWTVPAGATILNSTSTPYCGAGLTSISVVYNSNFAGGQVSVYASNACGNSNPRIRNIPRINIAAPITLSVVQPTCTVATATITVTAPVGSGYQYSIDGALNTPRTSNVFTNVLPGIHTITVSNNSVCVVNSDTTIVINPQPTIPVVDTVLGPKNICPYLGTGEVVTYTAQISGGTGTLTYNWTVIPVPGIQIVSGQGTPTLSVQFNTPYLPDIRQQILLSVTNECGTSNTFIKYLLSQTPVAPGFITPSSTDVCSAIATGSTITYCVDPVVAATSYDWTWPVGTSPVGPVNENCITLAFNSSFTGGDVCVKAVNNCGASPNRCYNITRNLPSVPGLITGPTIACTHVAPNGTPAEYTVPNVPGVTYNWIFVSNCGSNIVIPGTTNTVSVLFPTTFCGGTMQVTATNGCSTSGVRSLIVPARNTVSTPEISTVQPDCQTGTGSVTVTSPVGAGYIYTLTQDGAADQISTTPSFSNLTPGNYQVYAINNDLCLSAAFTSFTMDPLPALNPVIIASGPTTFCEGGSVTLDANTGNANDTYVWTPGGATTSSIIANTSGTYTVTVTTPAGCVGSASVVVTVNPLPVAVITASGPTTFCEGGSVTLDANTGDPSDTYVWTPGGATTSSITVTSSDTYTVTVTTAAGCEASASEVVTVNPLPIAVITPSGSTTFCEGDQVDLVASGGSSYEWSDGTSIIGSTSTITVTTSGTYTVTVTSAEGCTSTASIVITVNPLPAQATITIYGANPICEGSTDRLVASPSGAGYTYLWSPTNEVTQEIYVDATGTFHVTVSNEFGCSTTSSDTTIIVNPLPVPVVTPSGPLTICDGNPITLTATGGTPNSNYVWNTIPRTTTSYGQTLNVTNPGSYVITITNNPTGCNGSDTVVITNGTATSSSTDVTACDSYIWNGNDYTTSGTYVFNTTNSTGCDSTATLNLIINVSTSSSETVTACDTYNWNGLDYTFSGTYTFTTTNANGCDSLAILDLTITTSTSNTTVASACDTYTWSVDGLTYTTSGLYTSVTGCATEILDLTITTSTSNTTVASACDTYTWAVDGLTYTTSGSYTSVTGCATEILDLTITTSTSNTTVASACDTYTWSVDGLTYTTSGLYTSVTGCATEILDLTITTSTSNTTVASACDTYTWAVDGLTYTTSGLYTSVTGCATEILDLTITTSTSNTTVASACDTYTWAVDGLTYTTSGSYTSVTGCATEILDLTITTSTSNTTVASACDTYTWSVDGLTYTTSGLYTSVTGCATEILDLTITTSTSNTTVASACDTYTWAVDGLTYTTSGLYTSVTGCATEILDLTITTSTSNTTVASACDTYTWAVDGLTYTTSGSYTSVTGCATEILDLTITTSTSNTTVASACDTYTWSVDGLTYTTSGLYTSVTGCATEILDLTITTSTSNTTVASACDTYTWAVDGLTYTTSGLYTSVTGCATEILDLTITTSTSNTTVASACNTYTWAVDGLTYTTSGSYTSVTGCATEILDLTITTSTSNTTVASACDTYTWSVDGLTYTTSGIYSLVSGCNTEILDLTINTPTSSIENVVACNTYTWNGTVYTTGGTYVFNTTNAGGCDSTATLNLTINLSTTSTTDTAVCPNALPFVWNGNPYTTEGSYTFVTLNAAGCDSTAILNLSIVQPPVIAGVTGPKNICTYVGTGVEVTYSIVSPVPGVRYTWTVSPGINVMNAPTIGNTTVNAPDSINVTFSSSIGTDNAQIRVYATDLCGQRSLLYVYYLLSRKLVTPTFASNPAADICASIANGTTVTYTIDPIVGADSYCWNFTNTDGTPVTGVTVVSPLDINGNPYTFSTLCQVPFTSITVQYDASFISGNLTVAGINGCGLGGIRNLPITKAQKSVVISSPIENLCSFLSPNAPSEPIQFTATFNGVGGTFIWHDLTGFLQFGTYTNPTGTESYIVGIFSSNYRTGKLIVDVLYNCGVAHDTITLTATPPVAPASIDGPTAVCNYTASTGNVATYTVAEVVDATSYTWTVPDGCTIVGGQGTNTISVIFPNNFVGGDITVTANSNCGNSPTTALAIAACNGGKSSIPVSKNTIGLDNINLSVFPNPTTTEFRLNVNTTGKDQITVRVWDVQGKIIKTMKMMPYETIKFGNELKTGSYMVEVMQGNKKITQRVIKF